MGFSSGIELVTICAIPLIFALTLAEAAKAFMAKHLGDPTPQMLGFCTLNPWRFVDWLGTIVFPLAMILFGFPFMVGWAKPVIYDPRNFKNIRWDIVKVQMAAPMAHLMMCIAWILIFALLSAFKLYEWDAKAFEFFTRMANYGAIINMVLMIFVLLPIPPFPGSMVVMNLLPAKQALAYSRLQSYSLFIVIILAVSGVLGAIFLPAIAWLNKIMMGIAVFFL